MDGWIDVYVCMHVVGWVVGWVGGSLVMVLIMQSREPASPGRVQVYQTVVDTCGVHVFCFWS